MGRKRKNRKKNADRKAHAARKFADRAFQANVNVQYEEYKVVQKQYRGQLAILEEDRLQRSLFVTQVLDLRDSGNLTRLRQFFERQYGAVEDCRVSSFRTPRKQGHRGKSYPPAMVRLVAKDDAERIFGAPLQSVTDSKQIHCSVGARGTIRVAAAFPDRILDDLQDNKIRLDTSQIGVGHWLPSWEDEYLQCLDKQESPFLNNGKPNEDVVVMEEFVEMASLCRSSTRVTIDLGSRSIQFQSRRLVDIGGILDFGGMLGGLDMAGIGIGGGNEILSIRFKHIRGHMELCRDETSTAYLVFSLRLPPRLYHQGDPKDGAEQRRVRSTTFQRVDAAKFGMFVGFKISLSETSLIAVLMHKSLKELKGFGLFRKDLQDDNVMSIRVTSSSQQSQSTAQNLLDDKIEKLHKESPQLGFLLRACFDGGSFSEFHFYREREQNLETKRDCFCLVEELLGTCTLSEEAEEAATEILGQISRSGQRTAFPLALFRLLAPRLGDDESFPKARIADQCARVPKVLITPCRIRVMDTESELSNRTLRQYASAEKFGELSMIRVQVTDEDGSKLFDLTEAIVNRMKNILLEGLMINCTRFQFLGYSSSQLKQVSLWCVALPKGWTIPKLRSSLGNFRQCLTTSKLAARLGQCFTTTSAVSAAGAGVALSSGNGCDFLCSRKPDVPSSIKGKLHSDGTGSISRRCFNQYLPSVPFSPADPNCASIIQVRFGGAKGTLSAWNSIEDSKDIVIRESMMKFEAPLAQLEVCKIGSTIPYYLNRHVILLLSAHGVPQQHFLDIQDEMLKKLDEMLHCPDAAREMLPRLSRGPDKDMKRVFMQLLNNGVLPHEEPFLFSCLHAMRSHHIYGLRKKSRILVHDGCVLMGGMDETGHLPEGCVFVQCEKANDRHTIIEGPVMVTKHPAMHPGDTRMLKAVNLPSLREHRNVILFSRHGRRPEPDKMSGSDLDGDEFAVTWDSRLFLKSLNGKSRKMIPDKDLVRANAEPMSYDPPKGAVATPLPGDASGWSDALITHFFHHAKADNLGYIATLWLDYAATRGATCQECLKLAELHSVAVDFPKSGIPVAWEALHDLAWKGPKPHWREVKNRGSTKCLSVIGQLYDKVVSLNTEMLDPALYGKAMASRRQDRYGTLLSVIDSQPLPSASNPFDQDVLVKVYRHPSKKAIEYAGDLLDDYEFDLHREMMKYDLRGEGELFTGCIRKYHKLHKRKQHDLAQQVRLDCQEFRKEYQRCFFDCVLGMLADVVSIDDMFNVVTAFLAEWNDNQWQSGRKREDVHTLDDFNDDEWGALLSLSVKAATCPPEDLFLDEQQTPSLSILTMRQMREFSRDLASACYIRSYAPEFRKHRTTVFFSFPWIVAGNVICAALNE